MEEQQTNHIFASFDQDNFRGVMEMMQDSTHIRQLEGEQRLLYWSTEKTQPNYQHEVDEIHGAIISEEETGNISPSGIPCQELMDKINELIAQY